MQRELGNVYQSKFTEIKYVVTEVQVSVDGTWFTLKPLGDSDESWSFQVSKDDVSNNFVVVSAAIPTKV